MTRNRRNLSNARPASKGHVATIGVVEYFHSESGDLYRASTLSPLDVWGYAQDARWECAPRADGHMAYLISIGAIHTETAPPAPERA
jgi:hypothetical protein